MSVYGDLKIEHTSGMGAPKQVGIVKGIAVYTPNAKRIFQMELDKKSIADYRSGSLKITYTSQSDTKPEKYTEAELKLK